MNVESLIMVPQWIIVWKLFSVNIVLFLVESFWFDDATWRHVRIFVSFDIGNGLAPDGTKRLHKSLLTHDQRDSVTHNHRQPISQMLPIQIIKSYSFFRNQCVKQSKIHIAYYAIKRNYYVRMTYTARLSGIEQHQSCHRTHSKFPNVTEYICMLAGHIPRQSRQVWTMLSYKLYIKF